MAIELLAWFCLCSLLYTYAGYPLAIWWLGRWRGRGASSGGDAPAPAVSLVISAHNEERVIVGKLDNCRDLDYPPGQLEVIVVSDASTDGTDEIVRERAGEGFRLFRVPERVGKVEGINRVVPVARGEILVLSDANSFYLRDAIRKLVRHFADGSVGLVSGQLRLANPAGAPAGRKESAYWRYECWVRRLESRLGRLMGATGPIYAFRRDLFRPVPPTMICDLMLPVRIALMGFRVLYDPEAVCMEDAATGVERELRRRIRNASRGTRTVVQLLSEALRGRHWGTVVQLISHKPLRWTALVFLLGLLVGSCYADGDFFRTLLILQTLFYAAALGGWFLESVGARRNPFLGFYFLVAAHAASLMGVVIGLLSRGKPYWSPRNA